jgi:hypothetical protein
VGSGGEDSDAASGKISRISKILKEARRNFRSTFQDIEDAKKFKNHQRIYRKY